MYDRYIPLLSEATLKDEDIQNWVNVAAVTHMRLEDFQNLNDLQRNAVVMAVNKYINEVKNEETKRTQAITKHIQNSQQSQPQPLAKPSFIQY